MTITVINIKGLSFDGWSIKALDGSAKAAFRSPLRDVAMYLFDLALRNCFRSIGKHKVACDPYHQSLRDNINFFYLT